MGGFWSVLYVTTALIRIAQYFRAHVETPMYSVQASLQDGQADAQLALCSSAGSLECNRCGLEYGHK